MLVHSQNLIFYILKKSIQIRQKTKISKLCTKQTVIYYCSTILFKVALQHSFFLLSILLFYCSFSSLWFSIHSQFRLAVSALLTHIVPIYSDKSYSFFFIIVSYCFITCPFVRFHPPFMFGLFYSTFNCYYFVMRKFQYRKITYPTVFVLLHDVACTVHPKEGTVWISLQVVGMQYLLSGVNKEFQMYKTKTDYNTALPNSPSDLLAQSKTQCKCLHHLLIS